MELLLITAGRLKIVMSSADMEKYEITCDCLGTEDDRDAKRVLRDILEQARSKVGFDAKGNRILVQMFPSKDGGCEMYVTKSQNEALPMPIHTPARRIASVFRFGSADLLIGACRKLTARRDILASAAFADQEGSSYYLLIYTPERDAFGREPMFLSVANEYGSLMKTDCGVAYLYEHCDCICSTDAINTLGALG